MNTKDIDLRKIREELEDSDAVTHCAARYGNTGDPTSMRACFLMRRHPDLTVSQLALLAGVSVSAMSRCLRRLSHSEVASGRREGKAVYYSLENNEFTRLLVRQLEGGAA